MAVLFDDFGYRTETRCEKRHPISENNNVSRNNAYKIIKDSLDKLNNFEDKLKLIEKRKKIEEIINDKKIIEKIEEYI